MGGIDKKQKPNVSVSTAARRRLYLFFLFCCAVFLFILIVIWQTRGQSGDIYTSLSNLIASGQSPTKVISANLQNSAVTYDEIDPAVWRTVSKELPLLTVNNYGTSTAILAGLYVRPGDQPATGDISGTFNSGLSVNPDAVALGTDTTGNYVSSVVGGLGLLESDAGEDATVTLDVKAGAGISADSNGVAVNIQSGGGLAFAGDSLSLLTTCSDSQLLKWDAAVSSWVCGTDNAGSGSLAVRESDGSPGTLSTPLLEFGPASNSSDEFIVADQGGGTTRIRTGTAVPLTNAAATITGTWAYNSQIAANGGISCADCITLGSETTGNYLAGVLSGSGLTVSGSGSEAASPTVSLDTTNANNWSGVQTFTNGFTLNGNTYSNLAGAGLSFNSGALSSVLGAGIDSSEIINSTIVAADILDGTLTLAKLGQNACATNQTIKWDGLAWACATDTDTDTNTTYSAGSGLSLAGTTFSIDSALAMFKTIDTSLGTDPVADNLTDTLTLDSGSGVNVTGSATTDAVDFSLNLATGGGLVTSGNALTLLNTCSNGQYLAWTSGSTSWGCTSAASAPNVFQTVVGDSGSAIADTGSDTITVAGGNGLTSTGSDVSDTLTFNVDLASGSGLAFSSGALTLQSCSDGQILKRVAGSWACATDGGSPPASSYKQQLAGTDNVIVGSSLTPLLTNGSGAAQSLGVTIASGNEVSLSTTIELSSSLATGPVVYTLIRDDNHDNDCVTGGGDGTQIGGQVTSFIASVAQSFTTSIVFADSAPVATTGYYQLCASTSIAIGTASVTDRALTLTEINL
jgi:hypothetical protein